MRDRVPVTPVQGRARPFGVAPVCPRGPGPPVLYVRKVHRPGRPRKDERSRYQQFRDGAEVVGGVGRPFRPRYVARRFHEPAELRHRYRVLIDPEPVDGDVMDGALFGVKILRSHQELAAGDPDHVFGRSPIRLYNATFGPGPGT